MTGPMNMRACGGRGTWPAFAGATLAALALLTTAPAAHAQDLFSSYVTKVTGIRPALPGISAHAQADGADITVRNTSATPVVVEGYQHEPYLKITDHGVWQNKLSPAVYLNKEQFIDSIPNDVNAKRAPIWVPVSGRNFATWHDHRIHWMNITEPPAVAAAPDKPHLITRWTIPITSGHTTGAIVGTLTWQPSGHLGRYITWGVGAFTLLVVAILIWIRRRRGRGRPPGTEGAPATVATSSPGHRSVEG
jgi:hypothetical protein